MNKANAPVKKIENRLRINRVTAMSLVFPFWNTACMQYNMFSIQCTPVYSFKPRRNCARVSRGGSILAEGSTAYRAARCCLSIVEYLEGRHCSIALVTGSVWPGRPLAPGYTTASVHECWLFYDQANAHTSEGIVTRTETKALPRIY